MYVCTLYNHVTVSSCTCLKWNKKSHNQNNISLCAWSKRSHMNVICFNYHGLCMPQKPLLCQFFALTPIFIWQAGEKPDPRMEIFASQAIVINFWILCRCNACFRPYTCTLYILVMQHFQVVYHGISHKSLVFSVI